MGYVPIFSSILRSSILLEDVATRWLWTVILILADESRDSQGVIDCPMDRLAQIANLDPEQTRESIAKLCSDDDKSSSKVEGGKRLVPLDHQDGFEDRKWRVVNWDAYKQQVRRMQVAAAVKRHREKSSVIDSNQESSDVNPPTPAPTPSPTPNGKTSSRKVEL